MSETSTRSSRGGRGDPVGLSDIGGGLRKTAAKNPATERLLEEAEAYLAAQAERMVGAVGSKLGNATRGLADMAEGNSNPVGLLGRMVKEKLGGASAPTALAKAGLKGVADKAKSVFKRGGKGGSGGKSMNIVEDLEVGVPLRVAYNHWTQYQQFPKWSKGAQSVELEDPTKSTWKGKIAWSNRSWTATITEQIPDERIAWRSEGQTEVNGVVSFHPLEDELTKVLVVLEYIPHGFFEKTANLWRAPGRRARLDLKLFRRYVMMHADKDDAENGWRGEIRDGEIVREHDEVVKEEKAQTERGGKPGEEDEDFEDEYDREEPTDEDEDEYGEAGEDEDEYDEEEPEEEPEEEEPADKKEKRKEPAGAGRRARPPRQRRSEDERSRKSSRR